ncbi:MAG: TrkH family potassium uptake protein [Clostridia bacterium]|nr:TrkH family potassium uptake protein [Clostridia bacterium]
MNTRYIVSILGKLLLVEALLLLAPFAVAVYYGEETVFAYALTMGLLLLVGGATFLLKGKNGIIRPREGLATAGLAWIVFSLFGALPLWMTGDIPVYLDAVFEVVSGFTTTGATILADVEALSQSALFWRSLTHWIGGMGVLVFALAILPATDTKSMHLMRAEMAGPEVSKLVSKIRLTARLLYVIYIVLTLIEFVLLLFGDMPVYDALTHSFATAGTGGFSNKALSVGAYESPYIEWVITAFMLLFSINFNLFYLVLIGNFASLFKNEELRCFLCIVLGATAIITLNILPLYDSIGEAIRKAAFQVVSIMSTAGFATADFNLWPNLSRTLLVLLMFFGACAGSTGGGMKIYRIMVVCKTAVAQIRRQIDPRLINPIKVEGAILNPATRSGITAYMFAFFAIFAVSNLLLCFDDTSLVVNFTAVVTCINNVGPGLEEIGPMGSFAGFSPFSKLVLIFDMLVGRLEIFPVLALFAPSAWKKS